MKPFHTVKRDNVLSCLQVTITKYPDNNFNLQRNKIGEKKATLLYKILF